MLSRCVPATACERRVRPTRGGVAELPAAHAHRLLPPGAGARPALGRFDVVVDGTPPPSPGRHRVHQTTAGRPELKRGTQFALMWLVRNPQRLDEDLALTLDDQVPAAAGLPGPFDSTGRASRHPAGMTARPRLPSTLNGATGITPRRVGRTTRLSQSVSDQDQLETRMNGWLMWGLVLPVLLVVAGSSRGDGKSPADDSDARGRRPSAL